VHSADHDPLFTVQDRCERVRAANHVAACAQCFVVLCVARADRRREDDQISVRDVRSFLAEVKAEPDFFEPIDLNRARLIRSADGVSERHQQTGNAAHTRASNTDEVNLQFTPDEDVCKDLARVQEVS
jgi:hypothetical protein